MIMDLSCNENTLINFIHHQLTKLTLYNAPSSIILLWLVIYGKATVFITKAKN